MEFKRLRDLQNKYIDNLLQGVDTIFVTGIDKETIWNKYLDSFPPGTNEIFRTRREFDCSCCRGFIKNLGNVIVYKNNKFHTIWGMELEGEVFSPVFSSLNDFVLSAKIVDVFITKETQFGTEVNREQNEETGNILTWHHFWYKLPTKFVYKLSSTVDTIKSEFRTNRNVLESSLLEINPEAVEIALDLISQNTLYRGDVWKDQLERFLVVLREYRDLVVNNKDTNAFCWLKSIEVGTVLSKIKNSSIGTLLVDLSNNVEVEVALRKYEAVTAPTNYKRPTAAITPKMVEQAKKALEELGLIESLPRRFAQLGDISVNDVLFVDRDTKPQLAKDVFSKLVVENTKINPKQFDRVEEVSAQDFVDKILSRVSRIELLVENKHLPNFCSLIAPQNKEAKPITSWGNNFGWSYNGNIADSDLRKRVQELGGRVDGLLRFSHTWNYDKNRPNQSLMDLHVFFPGYSFKPEKNKLEVHDKYPTSRRVGWNLRVDSFSGSNQDVDYTAPPGSSIPVENIVLLNVDKLPQGIYTFKIHNWKLRSPTKSGFKAEIETGGQIFTWECEDPLNHKQWITVAQAELKNGVFTVNPILPTKISVESKKVWNITTQTFVPVHAISYSPNHWGDNKGQKHYMFWLKDCVNPEQPNGFYNEFLPSDLIPHRKVFEVLGREMKVEKSDNQLSGLGFSSTQRNSIVVKVTGATQRVLRINF